MAAQTRTDKGCLAYSFSADLEDDDRILGPEIWRDRDALAAHMAHDHTAAFLAVVPGLVIGEPVMSSYDAP